MNKKEVYLILSTFVTFQEQNIQLFFLSLCSCSFESNYFKDGVSCLLFPSDVSPHQHKYRDFRQAGALIYPVITWISPIAI